MDINSMKNIIVLKNLPSNMVEEAFVILKSNARIHKPKLADKKYNGKKDEKPITNDYVIKEAEMIVTDYISKLEKREYEISSGNKRLSEKYKRMKALNIFLAIFSILSIISIILR